MFARTPLFVLAVSLLAALAPQSPAADEAETPPTRAEAGVPAAAPPAPDSPQVEAEQWITTLNDAAADERARRVAAVRLKNLSGDALPALEKAAARQDLSPEARSAVDDATPPVSARARRDKAARESIAGDLQSMLDAYDAAGRKDPRWDGLVREAIRAASRKWAESVGPFKKAKDAGCDDPFVEYLYNSYALATGQGDREDLSHGLFKSMVALSQTAYPPEWKCRAATTYFSLTEDPDAEALDICLKNLPGAVAETKLSSREFYKVVQSAFRLASELRGADAAFEEVHAAYAAGRPANDPYPHVFKAERYKNWAWEARGAGYAHTVTEDGWELFRQRLAVARKSIQAAWKADPTDPLGPTLMITIVMGSTGSKPEMEMWFTRAMQNNPDNRQACLDKLYFLYPRWHGSHREMIAFGRECLATQNWYAPLPTILPDAHRQVAKESNDPKAYYRQPAVWKDVEEVHKSFFEVFPNSPNVAWHRNRLAKWACDCEQWDEAVRQFAKIGDDDIDRNVFASKAVFDYYRRKAQNRANKVQEVRAF